MSLSGGDFCLTESIWQCLETVLIVILGEKCTGMKWVEANDAVKHPTVHMTVPQPPIENFLVSKTTSAKLEKPWE